MTKNLFPNFGNTDGNKKKNRSQNARLKIVPKNSGDKNFVPKILGTMKIAPLGGGVRFSVLGTILGTIPKKWEVVPKIVPLTLV